MPRLFRESPLNGIWEGSGNVICLDVLRAMGREPASVDAFREEVLAASGADARFDAHCLRLDAILADHDDLEARARRIVEAMAAGAAGVAADPGRVAPRWRTPSARRGSTPRRRSPVYGTLPSGVDAARDRRARPAARR